MAALSDISTGVLAIPTGTETHFYEPEVHSLNRSPNSKLCRA